MEGWWGKEGGRREKREGGREKEGEKEGGRREKGGGRREKGGGRREKGGGKREKEEGNNKNSSKCSTDHGTSSIRVCVCVCVHALTVQVLPPAFSEATLSPLDSVVTCVSGTFSKD